jgi:hypothetical protein
MINKTLDIKKKLKIIIALTLMITVFIIFLKKDNTQLIS